MQDVRDHVFIRVLFCSIAYNYCIYISVRKLHVERVFPTPALQQHSHVTCLSTFQPIHCVQRKSVVYKDAFHANYNVIFSAIASVSNGATE